LKPDSQLAQKIEKGEFIITAEFLPRAGTNGKALQTAAKAFGGNKITAVNVSDNHFGIVMSSIAASLSLSREGLEPVLQMVTRDRNRIALQSDLIGAAHLGIKNVLCLTGYHQSLTGNTESTNVFDIDSIQFVASVKRMRDEGLLLDGTKLEGEFSLLIGAAANPFLTPLELNIIRLAKKVEAGADFLQTQAVFDVEAFIRWFEAANQEGIPQQTAILAGVLPLESAAEAQRMSETYTDIFICEPVVKRLQKAGDSEAQKKEGLALCAEIVQQLREIEGLRGIHILSGSKESKVPEILTASGL
jgi:methylenetetrahydrofolate reductase (NADPH)